LPALHESSTRAAFAANNEYALALAVLKAGVNIEKKHVTQAIPDQTDQMKAHLVLVREPVPPP